MSLGNQLNGVRLVDEGLRARYKAAYPDQVIQPPDPPSRTTTQENKVSVPDNDSASTQIKSSPASTQKVEVVTAASTVAVSTTIATSVDEKAHAQDSEMLVD
jgi:mRNA (2'-O-methyladenosine-N6-)-methyltransferase